MSLGAKFQPRKKSFYENAYGVIFLGTPHRGSPWAPWAKLASNLAKLALQAPSTTLLQSLQVDSPVLQIIADEFSKMVRSDEIKVYSFREERGMSGLYGFDAKVPYMYILFVEPGSCFVLELIHDVSVGRSSTISLPSLEMLRKGWRASTQIM